jgi:hypothetical protein
MLLISGFIIKPVNLYKCYSGGQTRGSMDAVTTSNILSSLFISRGCVPGNRHLNRKLFSVEATYAILRGPSRYEIGQNKINLDTVIYVTFVTKFSFYFQIWHIYIYKETTYIELKQFITKIGHKKSRDVNRNDVYRTDL